MDDKLKIKLMEQKAKEIHTRVMSLGEFFKKEATVQKTIIDVNKLTKEIIQIARSK